MVEPTTTETLVALIAFSAFVILFVMAIFGLLERIGGMFQRLTNASAHADVRILMAEEMHLYRDPTAPTAEYGATNEAREHLRRRR